jgi:hypothetical protein
MKLVDLASGGEALFDSGAAPVDIDGGDDAGVARGVGVGAPPPPPGPPVMPSSMLPVNTTDDIRLKRVWSPAWNDFEEIFDTLPIGKKVRISKCKHCAQVLFGYSSAKTGHLLRQQKVCVAVTKTCCSISFTIES